MDLSAVVLDSPALKLTGNGTIGFDGGVHLDLSASVRGAATVPVLITGTLDRPQVRPR
jgi:hypothetical protein